MTQIKKSNSSRAGATRRGTTEAPLKNYLSESSLSNIFEAIRCTLAEGGARRIAFDYNEGGRATEITFSLPMGDQIATFRLPARQEAIGPLLKESYRVAGVSCPTGQAFVDRIERVAWANIRDWLSAQVALIRAKMVKPEEVFLPYLLNEAGQTYFEVFELPAPKSNTTIITQL